MSALKFHQSDFISFFNLLNFPLDWDPSREAKVLQMEFTFKEPTEMSGKVVSVDFFESAGYSREARLQVQIVIWDELKMQITHQCQAPSL